MTRAMMNATITFGMVTIPVGIHKATEDQSIVFNNYHRGCEHGEEARMGQKTFCKACGEFDCETVKGTTTEDGVVFIDADDLASLKATSDKLINVHKFVNTEQIDPLSFTAPYHLVPNKAGLPGYQLLWTALKESGLVGIVTYIYSGKENLAALRVMGNMIVLHKMVWADEVRTPQYPILDKPVQMDPRMTAMAIKLVESMAGDYNPTDYKDTYTERVQQVVDASQAGADLPVFETQTTEDVSNLLAALEASLEVKC